jgi:putative heme-binding domain-containing protein
VASSVGIGLATAMALILAGPDRTPAAPPEVVRRFPTPPPGWTLEVIAEAPAVSHPSVVCTAPDGRVFVAEDPMDISTPRADLAQGRIRCLHSDGRITTFADGLFAVFGMQYLDGKLYVLHNPRFSTFADGGDVGRDRADLIESTNPNPWALDWNDHVPANFRLAMDGYLYVAVGDKGVYGAVGRDGRRVDLHGGGILRLRPDGTGLEVFCTGVRNILDVALDAEDELFTYDNTDEHQWMSRLTHMVERGTYGYPYDFVPRRPYTLWMMADYSGGAATGASCYTEDALPPEYRGDLFLADFGKRQVLRVTTGRDGGTFRAIDRRDLFADVPEDFRPVGIAWSADGRSLYICDWQHRDTKEAVAVGRLLKLAHTGRSHAAPRPPWYVEAAMGRASRATTEELIRALSHPARSVRDVAQRRLAERGPGAVEPLTKLLNDAGAVPHARWHALWALDALDGGVAGRRAILAAVRDPEASVRRQAIRQLGTRRVRGATEVIVARLRDEDDSVRFRAATALGRIGDSAAVPGLIEALDEADTFARYAAFTALNRIGQADPSAWTAVVAGLGNPKAVVREGVGMALRETYDGRLIAALAEFARDERRLEVSRATALGLLAGAARRRPAWRGEWWAYHPALGTPPARSESWAATPVVLAILIDAFADARPTIRLAAVQGIREADSREFAGRLRTLFRADRDAEVRRAVLLTLGALHDQQAGGLIAEVLGRPEVNATLLAAAITAAVGVGGEEVSTALEQLLDSEHLGPSLLRPTITALGRLRWAAAVPHLIPHARSDGPEIRRVALESLVHIGGEPGRSALVPLARDADPQVRRAAVAALGDLRDRATIPTLLEAYRDPVGSPAVSMKSAALRFQVTESPAENGTAATVGGPGSSRLRENHPVSRPAAMAALVQVPDLRALDAYLEGLGGRDATLREGCRRAMTALRDQVLPAIEARAGRLSPEVVAQLKQIYEDHGPARRGRLFAIATGALVPEDYLRFTRSHPGDAARGRRLFHDQDGLGCVKCHKVGGEGGEVGPELGGIGAQMNRGQLAESVLYPSRAIREGYQATTLAMTDGRVYSGLVRSESGEVLVLRDADGKDHEILKSEIEERRSGPTSLMPEGLQVGLSPQDFADLIAYLESLRAASGVARPK